MRRRQKVDFPLLLSPMSTVTRWEGGWGHLGEGGEAWREREEERRRRVLDHLEGRWRGGK